MTKKAQRSKPAADKAVKNILRKTWHPYSSEEKIRIVLAGLRGEECIAVLCRREGIAESLFYSWSKEFLEVRPSNLCYPPNRFNRLCQSGRSGRPVVVQRAGACAVRRAGSN